MIKVLNVIVLKLPIANKFLKSFVNSNDMDCFQFSISPSCWFCVANK